jgi:hypothetical protein
MIDCWQRLFEISWWAQNGSCKRKAESRAGMRLCCVIWCTVSIIAEGKHHDEDEQGSATTRMAYSYRPPRVEMVSLVEPSDQTSTIPCCYEFISSIAEPNMRITHGLTSIESNEEMTSAFRLAPSPWLGQSNAYASRTLEHCSSSSMIDSHCSLSVIDV